MKVVLPAFAQRGGFIPDASAVSAVCDLEGGRCTTIAMVGRPEQPAAEQPESCPTEISVEQAKGGAEHARKGSSAAEGAFTVLVTGGWRWRKHFSMFSSYSYTFSEQGGRTLSFYK